jgi:peptidoglycan/LPS O-acetylase OafA/YrhL
VRWACFFGALLSGSILFWHVALARSVTAAFLGWWPVARFGDISYSFYLCHLFVVVGLRPVFRLWVMPVTGLIAGFWLFGITALLLSVGVSWVSRVLLEVRAGELAKVWLRRRLQQGPA